MKKIRLQRYMVALSMAGMLAGMTSCGDLSTIGEQVFNNTFLVDIGAKTGSADTQITPDLPQYVTLKVQNQTIYPAKIIINIKRAQTIETFEATLAAKQTVGKLIESCNSETNPVLSMYVPTLTEDVTAVPVGQVFVMVNGLPVLIAASQLPGVLNVGTDFNCGDTVEFVITTSFSDTDRYQVSAVVFEGNTED